MSRQKRPAWVLPNGDWEFKRHPVEIFSAKRTSSNDFEIKESQGWVLIELGRSNTLIPEWWEDGFDVKSGPRIKFKVRIIEKVPTFEWIHIESNNQYKKITSEDLIEISRNRVKILTWAVREIAIRTKQNKDGSFQIFPPNPLTEKQWISLGKEVQRLAGRHTVTNEHLKEISEIYMKAKKEGRPTTKAIEEYFHYSPSRARVLVVEARKEKLLDPVVKKGKKNATSRNK